MKRIMEKHTHKYLREKIGKKIQCIATTRDAYRNHLKLCIFLVRLHFSASFLASFAPSLSFFYSLRFVCSLCFSNDMIEIISTRASKHTDRAALALHLFERLASCPFELETINNHTHTHCQMTKTIYSKSFWNWVEQESFSLCLCGKHIDRRCCCCCCFRCHRFVLRTRAHNQ